MKVIDYYKNNKDHGIICFVLWCGCGPKINDRTQYRGPKSICQAITRYASVISIRTDTLYCQVKDNRQDLNLIRTFFSGVFLSTLLYVALWLRPIFVCHRQWKINYVPNHYFKTSFYNGQTDVIQ